MKTVLLFGAGMVARPLIRYFLKFDDYKLVVASKDFTPAIETLLQAHPQVERHEIDVQDAIAVNALVKESDVVVSLLPNTIHSKIVIACLHHRKHMITTSYLREDVQRYHQDALDKDILILMESGMDPGLDHLSAKKIIDDVHERGGKVTAFSSSACALPAPEASDNPFRYKFSWSPRGVLMATRSAARYLRDGRVIDIPGEQLFRHSENLQVAGMDLEVYPNRDSLPYIETYEIPEVQSIFRGSIRYPGWSQVMYAIGALGLLRDEPVIEAADRPSAKLLAALLGLPAADDLKKQVTARLKSDPFYKSPQDIIEKLAWLELFGDRPSGTGSYAPIDLLIERMREKMQYGDSERDMILIYHQFQVQFADRTDMITSMLLNYGTLQSDTAIASGVAYPAAAAARMILENRITARGTRIPVDPSIYNPMLEELSGLGFSFEENVTTLETASL